MNSENIPTTEPEQYDPNLEAQDEELTSGGNNRLLYIMVAVVLALVLGYVALPKGQGTGIASVTPSFMLDDAAVTATAPTGADSIAAGLKAAPTAAKATDDAAKATTKTVTTTTTKPVATAAAASPVAATVAASPVAATPEPAPAAAPEPVAPTTETISGKITDENGHALAGATVLLKGSSKVTTTDANGNYSLEVPSGNENTLQYGYGGYDDEEVHSSGSKPVNVALTPRAKAGRRRR